VTMRRTLTLKLHFQTWPLGLGLCFSRWRVVLMLGVVQLHLSFERS
jgi:hypothetical protein